MDLIDKYLTENSNEFNSLDKAVKHAESLKKKNRNHSFVILKAKNIFMVIRDEAYMQWPMRFRNQAELIQSI